MNKQQTEAYYRTLARSFPWASPEALRVAAELCLAWDEMADGPQDFPDLIREGSLLVEGLEPRGET